MLTTMLKNEAILTLIPGEILTHIFTFLTLKTLFLCRIVCLKWKNIIDRLTFNEKFWLKYCQKDYPNICDAAYIKSKAGLRWYHLYRSLTLWLKLLQAREERYEFAIAQRPQDEIQGIQILRNGIVGVHKKTGITYYDLKTFQRSKRCSLIGKCNKYNENDNFIIIHTNNRYLNIIKKFECNSNNEIVKFKNVKSFICIEDVIYYVTWDDNIFLCYLDKDELINTMLVHVPSGVMSLGHHSGFLCVMTFEDIIYLLIDNELKIIRDLKYAMNLFYYLRKYNFLDQLHWRLYYQRLTFCYQTQLGLLDEIVKLHVYGNVVFIGTSFGVLRIYCSKYTDDIFDVINTEPLKEYNLLTPDEIRQQLFCSILNIDVVEGKDSHTVVVALPKKVVVFNIYHTFKKAVHRFLSNSDTPDIKKLKISE